MTLSEATQLILDAYGAEPEHIFARYPGIAVFRRPDNGRWFAVGMADMPWRTLGVDREGRVDILNVKCDPIVMGSLRGKPGFRPAYHMNKDKWITILLDGSAEKKHIIALVGMSYGLTASRIRRIRHENDR